MLANVAVEHSNWVSSVKLTTSTRPLGAATNTCNRSIKARTRYSSGQSSGCVDMLSGDDIFVSNFASTSDSVKEEKTRTSNRDEL